MCDNSPDTPFCSPQDGAQVLTGETVEITWNPQFFTTDPFPSTPSPIFIQADFSIPSTGPPETAGFTSSPLDPSLGTFPWPVLDTYLPANSNLTSATLSIAAPLTQFPTNGTFTRIGEGTIRFPGPQLHILRGSVTTPTTTTATSILPTPPTPNTQQNQQQQQPQQPSQPPLNANATNPLAIALPIALGVFTAVAMASYILLKRRRPDLLAKFFPRLWPNPSPRGGRGTRNQGADKGYAEWPRSRAQKVKLRGRDVEIRVVRTDLEGLRANAARMAVAGESGMGMGMGMGMGIERGGGDRGNVFREEVRRQEVERDVNGGRV